MIKQSLILVGTSLLLGVNDGSLYSDGNNPELHRSTNFGITLANHWSMDASQSRGVFANMVTEKTPSRLDSVNFTVASLLK